MNNKISKATFIALIFVSYIAPNVAAARTLVEVEYRTSKGCKIVYYKDVSVKNDNKIEYLEWSGSCKKGYVDGDGTSTEKWSNGDINKTVASFVHGRKEGQGTTETTNANGIKTFFRGNFSRGMRQGIGDLTIELPNNNSIKYKGNFVDGLPEGQGRIDTSQWIYTGEFREFKPSGVGRFEYPSKIVYEGEVRDGKQNGNGKIIFPSGTTVIGYFSDDKPPSSGRIEYPNGSVYVVYEGQLEKFLPNGQGRLSFQDKTTYYGEFKNGKPDGEGVMEAPNGTRTNVAATEGKFLRRYDTAEREAISRVQEQRIQQEEAQQNANDAAAIGSLLNALGGAPSIQHAAAQNQNSQVCIYNKLGQIIACYQNMQVCILNANTFGGQCH